MRGGEKHVFQAVTIDGEQLDRVKKALKAADPNEDFLTYLKARQASAALRAAAGNEERDVRRAQGAYLEINDILDDLTGS